MAVKIFALDRSAVQRILQVCYEYCTRNNSETNRLEDLHNYKYSRCNLSSPCFTLPPFFAPWRAWGRVAQSAYRQATGWMVRGSNPGGGEIFRQSRTALGPTQPPVQCVPGLSRGKVRSGRGADTSLLLVPWSRKRRTIPLLSPMGRTVCTEPQCLYKGAFYLLT